MWCSPHHAYATEENTTIVESNNEYTHSYHKVWSSHSDNNEEDHCKEGNLGGIDVYVHKDSFHDLAQGNLLSIMPVPFFMVQEKNDAYFYQKWIGIYKKQLYHSETAYANERKNIIEVLI